MDSLPLEFQLKGSSLKGMKDIWGGTELLGIRVKARGPTFYQTGVLVEATFYEPIILRASRQVPYLKFC